MDKKLTKEDIAKLLKERFKKDSCQKLSDIPSPNLFKDIKKASSRIKDAIVKKEKIAIVGDYDADGIISSVILTEFFDDLKVSYILKIPNRFNDGYGISPKIVQNLNVDVIITVDNGISAIKAGEVCQKKGIDLIITDHHTTPKTLPKAYAIVNPKQNSCNFPYSEICGAQVAWYLVAKLKEELNLEYNLAKFLDILAIAIVADMMPLKDINRTMVKTGLKHLNKANRPFLKAIKAFYNKKQFVSEDISYLLAPLINSSGRLEDAMLSYELIKEKDEDEAFLKLDYIVMINNKRKLIESELFEKSLEIVDSDKDIIIAWGKKWHEGVIGIVAARLARKFKKPSIVFSVVGEKAKGSARSVGDIDILKHITKNSNYLLGFGGHKGAAGMSIETTKLKEFKKAMEKSLATESKEKFKEKKSILGEIDVNAIDFELLDILEYYEPYGEKNPKPRFLVKDVFVKQQQLLGKEQNHQKIIISNNFTTVESIQFNHKKSVKDGETIAFTCTINKNSFRGRVNPQLIVDELILD
jgi:single-stranded-DNA-specific exonuclease